MLQNPLGPRCSFKIDGDYIDTRDSDDETYDPANPDHDDYF